MPKDTELISLTADPRFFFYAYIPKSHSLEGSKLPLVVIIHGIKRDAKGYIDEMRRFCEQHSCALICPLFPEGVPNPKQLNSYKDLFSRGTRFDNILLSMIEQAGRTWRIQTDRFYLHGFSAGGQFVHRFTYLYPDRLAAVSIGAPGRLTAPNTQSPWLEGVANISEVFGLSGIPNFAAMARLPVHFVVGEKDVGTSMIDSMKNPTRFEIEAGNTRVARIKWLKAAWEEIGVVSEMSIVPGVGHDGLECLSAVKEWLGRQLAIGM
ncbi:poly hydrolase [Lentinula aciculospora]|uniref:Poly hydrolase n=1 Tax=Lentinula aciculospora TaxID=153920 RepID=A0A9W8ZWX5_9AGAR|nr:poly hydrolase [Lentinula aciculospora]